MTRNWTAEALLEAARSFQVACVLAAAADLELFTGWAQEPLTAEQLARRRQCNLRSMGMLLDALAALGLLHKQDDRYLPAPTVAELLQPDAPGTVLPMLQHQANCLRRWAQLACVVQSGEPAPPAPSIRGAAADQAAFIGAMHTICGPVAAGLLAELPVPPFRHLLDVGGASGTWTIAFLRAFPEATATLFDLPEVIPLAERRLSAAGLTARVTLVGGDFTLHPLPTGADLAWLSAIVHQQSRAENQVLFRQIHTALRPGGHLLLRDVVMDDARTAPLVGALFALNMLAGTPRGGTFTFAELRTDLEAAGFVEATLLHRDEGMNSVVQARRT
ncbi:MAG TPA: methyltransferase [Phycisphaerae bacterium]|nr:methyltransferase [Phycisphaerae bacterium]HNU46013.1 methyltransferase [Phycisphaerae bacterium]